MSTVLDLALRPVALQLINQFGKNILLKSLVDSSYDPETGTTVADGSTYAIKGIIEEPSTIDFSSGFSRLGDRKVTVASLGLPENVVPKPGDILILDILNYVEWTVVSMTETFSGEDVAIYTLSVRR